MPHTADTPKCLAQVQDRAILDWIVESLRANAVARIAFIGGYRIEKVQAAYPELAYYHNAAWERNNILASLMTAEAEMEEAFLCCYSDTLFTSVVIGKLLACPADIAVVVDTDWRARYAQRSQHPPDDAEKVTARNGRITAIERAIEEGAAYGEFTGIAKFNAAGAGRLREHYRRFRQAGGSERAYLIELFQQMIEAGVEMAHVDTAGEYMEIDTQEDFELARRGWGT